MAFEISEAGIAAARIGARAELDFLPLKPGTLAVSPLKENVLDPDEFVHAVRESRRHQAARKRTDVALILPDFSARISVLDFDQFPTDPKEQASLIRFRLKRSVPFDVESAAISYWAQQRRKGQDGRGGGDGAAGNCLALRSAVPRRRNESRPGDHLCAGRSGTGARGRAQRVRQAHRPRAHGAGARQDPAEAGALPGIALAPNWTISPPCWCPPSSTSKTISAAAPKSSCSAASAPPPRRRSVALPRS